MIRTIQFHGALRDTYGAEHQVVGNTMQQIFAGLACQLGNKFKAAIKAGQFHLFKDEMVKGKDVDEAEIEMTIGKATTIHVVPVTAASGSMFRVVVGIVLIVVGTYFKMPFLTKVGTAMVLGGVAEMLAPKPTSATGQQEQTGQNPSFIFNGTVNVTEQGGPPPIVYGRVNRASSVVLSASLTVERM